ncbi:MAG: ATP-binding cassette domain-containing protein, partial [Acidimicrobiales bacterium]
TVVVLGFAFIGYAAEERADPRLAGSTGRLRFLSSRRVKPATPSGPATEDATGPMLAVRDLTVAYAPGAPPVVTGVSFEARRGTVTALVGESGSGKSTIVLSLLGLLPGEATVDGDATFDGQKLVARRVRGRRIGFVTQAAMNALNPAYTIHRQITEAAELTMPRGEAQARAHELLELVGLPPEAHGTYPHELSGGMRQRVVIAMALANRPDLLIADEPTTGLDLVTQASIITLLNDLKDRLGLTVLLISHDVPMVLRVADELVILEDGVVVERGPAAAVADDPTEEYTRRLLGTRLSLIGAVA